MDDLIRREDAIDALDELLDSPYARQEPFGFAVRDVLKLVRDMMNGDVPKSLSIPAVDAVEVRHGTWERDENGNAVYYCSECHEGITMFPPTQLFCYHCGARMDGEDGDT